MYAGGRHTLSGSLVGGYFRERITTMKRTLIPIGIGILLVSMIGCRLTGSTNSTTTHHNVLQHHRPIQQAAPLPQANAPLLSPSIPNAYGPGVSSDATGRPYATPMP